MVSFRVSLLLLCVAIAAHSITACSTVTKGNSIGIAKNLTVVMERSVKKITVNLRPTNFIYQDLTGFEVTICDVGGSKLLDEGSVEYKNNNLIITRPEKLKSILTIDITYTYLLLGGSKVVKAGLLR